MLILKDTPNLFITEAQHVKKKKKKRKIALSGFHIGQFQLDAGSFALGFVGS